MPSSPSGSEWDLDHLSLEQLMNAFLKARRRGDVARAADAFELIAWQVYSEVLKYQRGKMASVSQEDSEDVAATTVERLVSSASKSAHNFKGNSPSQLWAYIYTTADNTRNDFWKKRKRRDEIAKVVSIDAAADSEHGPTHRELATSDDDLTQIEVDEIFFAVLSDSPRKQRPIIWDRWQGIPAKETAMNHGLTPSNVDQIYKRFNDRLRTAWNAHQDGGANGNNGEGIS
jgi:RNA polymerase sigma factor (sigma-70 family)